MLDIDFPEEKTSSKTSEDVSAWIRVIVYLRRVYLGVSGCPPHDDINLLTFILRTNQPIDSTEL